MMPGGTAKGVRIAICAAEYPIDSSNGQAGRDASDFKTAPAEGSKLAEVPTSGIACCFEAIDIVSRVNAQQVFPPGRVRLGLDKRVGQA